MNIIIIILKNSNNNNQIKSLLGSHTGQASQSVRRVSLNQQIWETSMKMGSLLPKWAEHVPNFTEMYTTKFLDNITNS